MPLIVFWIMQKINASPGGNCAFHSFYVNNAIVRSFRLALISRLHVCPASTIFLLNKLSQKKIYFPSLLEQYYFYSEHNDHLVGGIYAVFLIRKMQPPKVLLWVGKSDKKSYLTAQ